MKEQRKLLVSGKGRYLIPLSGNKTAFNLSYQPTIDLSGNYEIALISLDTYYSTPNITTSNNSQKVWNGLVWNTVSISEGSYDIDAISSAINTTQVIFAANTATLKAVLRLVSPYQVDFDVPNLLSYVLGFKKQIYYSSGSTESENTVNITATTTNLLTSVS